MAPDTNTRGRRGLSPAARETACGTGAAGKFDVQENEREVVVWAQLPGLTESDLDLQVQGETLTVIPGWWPCPPAAPKIALVPSIRGGRAYHEARTGGPGGRGTGRGLPRGRRGQKDPGQDPGHVAVRLG